jgi:hypothetical protein
MSDLENSYDSNLDFDQSVTPKRYQYTHMDVSYVAENINEYIIPECRQACKLLWDKNIFTYLCTNYDNDYTAIAISEFSAENQKIYYELSQTDSRLINWRGLPAIRLEATGKEVIPVLNGLTDLFRMQDVLYDGYYTIESFLIERGCYNIVDNPRYMKDNQSENSKDLQAMMKHLDDYNDNTPHIYVYDETKVKRSLASYLKEAGLTDFYVPHEGKIFKNEFYFKAHKNYLSFIGLTSLL